MATNTKDLDDLVKRSYRHGFVTDIEPDTVPPGPRRGRHPADLGARRASREFMLEWRLKAYRHWLTMQEPHWAHVHYPPIDYQAISYYSAPKPQEDAPKSLDEVDPKLLETYDKLGIPLHERAAARRRRGRRGVRQRLGRARRSRTSSPRRASSSARSPRPCRSIRSWCEKYLGTRRAVHRQLLRDAELGGVHRRLVRATCRRACAARWSCRRTSASTRRTPASSSAR